MTLPLFCSACQAWSQVILPTDEGLPSLPAAAAQMVSQSLVAKLAFLQRTLCQSHPPGKFTGPCLWSALVIVNTMEMI